MPQISSEYRLPQVTQDLLTVLKNPYLRTPFLDHRDKTINDINKPQIIFKTPQQYDTSETSSPPRVTVTDNQAPRVLRSDVARRKYPRVADM